MQVALLQEVVAKGSFEQELFEEWYFVARLCLRQLQVLLFLSFQTAIVALWFL